MAPTGQRKADRERSQEGAQTAEAAAPPARCKPCKGGGRLRQPPFHSGACPASQGTSEAGPGGYVWRSTSARSYFHANLAGHPHPGELTARSGRGQEGTAPLREAGEGPRPRPSRFPVLLDPPSRACLPRIVLFVTKDTHCRAFLGNHYCELVLGATKGCL